MAFKKLNGQERDFFYRFYILLVFLQKIAEITIYRIVVVLITKHFKANLFELFFGANCKYVLSVDQG